MEMTLTSHLVNANLWGITQVASIKISDLQPADSESFLNDLTNAELTVRGGLSNNFNLFAQALLIAFAISTIVELVKFFYYTDQKSNALH